MNLPKEMDEKALKELVKQYAEVDEYGKKIAPSFKLVKIVKDKTILGPDGEPTTKGFGFIEFRHHLSALTALKNMNNVPGVVPGHPKRRLILEFAIENAVKLNNRQDKLQRESKKRKFEADHEQNQAAEPGEEEPPQKRRLTSGEKYERLIQKRVLARQTKREAKAQGLPTKPAPKQTPKKN